ncbi:hypothetical protein [Flaviaesturariibacter terrae]
MKDNKSSRNVDPQRDRLSNTDKQQTSSGQGSDSRTNRGGTTDLGTTGNATRRGDSGISTKRTVTGSDYDGQVSGS